jgi:hypothetical protein
MSKRLHNTPTVESYNNQWVLCILFSHLRTNFHLETKHDIIFFIFLNRIQKSFLLKYFIYLYIYVYVSIYDKKSIPSTT